MAAKLASDGHAAAATEADVLVGTLEGALHAMREHRKLIIAELTQEAGQGG